MAINSQMVHRDYWSETQTSTPQVTHKSQASSARWVSAELHCLELGQWQLPAVDYQHSEDTSQRHME